MRHALDEPQTPPPPTQPGARWSSWGAFVAAVLAFTHIAPCLIHAVPLDAPPAAGEQDTVALAPPPTRAVPGQFVVRFRAPGSGVKLASPAADFGPGIAAVRLLRPTLAPGAALAGVGPALSALDQMALIVTDGSLPADQVRARLEAHPAIAYLEPNTVLTTLDDGFGGVFPGDFRFNDQWGLLNAGLDGSLAGADIDAPLAWRYGTGDPGVKVAVIDTGIDYFHPDLEANIWVNPGEIPGNGVDDDHNGYIDDVHGYDFVSNDGDPMDDQIHGTHVAGTIGAAGDNDIGVAGVCWQASLMALKAFNERGEGTLFDVLAALRYAVASGAHIINASWGQSDKSQALADAIAEAHTAGLIIVASAGNTRNDSLSYPAAYPEPVTVAATNNRDQRSMFSSYGAAVDVAAPGEQILSTVTDNRYDFSSGTSMAAPHVTGVAALVLSRHPDFTNTQVEDILRSTVDPVSDPQYIGLGRLNAAKAVHVKVPLPTARLTLPATLSGRVSLGGSASGPRFQRYMLDYGQGVYPTNWTRLHTGTTPVDRGPLLSDWSTTALGEGSYVIRLTVQDTLGQAAIDRATVTVRNVVLATPVHNDILRAGDPVALRGTVFGAGRTYTIEHGIGRRPWAWSTAGITLAHDGRQEVIDGILGTWDTRAVGTNEFYTLRLTAWEEGQSVGTSLQTLVYLDERLRPGWPQYVTAPVDHWTNDWRHVTVADLDHDGAQEIVAVQPGDLDVKPARLLVYGVEGDLRWSRDLASGLPSADIVTVGDLEGDGWSELFVDTGDSGLVLGFRHDGTPLAGGWPAQVGATNLGKTLADLDGDGKLELIAYGRSAASGAYNTGVLAVVNADGTVRHRWTFPGAALLVDAPRSFAAVGDLDDDPDLEIVAILRGTDVGLFDVRKPDGPVWVSSTQGSLSGSPAIGDLDGDHRGNIIVAAYDAQSTGKPGTRGGVYAFDREGRLLPGWPVLIDRSFVAPPALGDFDGDGRQEIVAVDWGEATLHVLRSDGFELPGWPVGPILANPTASLPTRGIAKSMPLVGDADGDGRADVVLITPGAQNQAARLGDVSLFGGVKAWSATGVALDLHPRSELTALVMESGRGKAPPPILTDLDGNGKLDVVASTVEDVGFAGVTADNLLKRRFSIYAWELEVPYTAASQGWPAFQRDPQHSGWIPSPKPVNRPPVLSPIPSQTVRTGGSFFPLELDRYVVDPDNAAPTLVWRIEGAVALTATLNERHVLRVEAPTPTWSGAETLRFVVRDPGGLESFAEATFAARVDYEPPEADGDVLELNEDAEAELNPLANDTHPHGLPLRLLQVSRAHFGRVTVLADDRVRYQPTTNYFGEDSFTYMVGDGLDGMALGLVTVQVRPVPDPPVAAEDHAITLENEPVTIKVLANDTDPDGPPPALAGFTPPGSGRVEALPDHSLRYHPNLNWSGNDRFTYRIGDADGFEAIGTVNLQVKPVNTAPLAQDLAFVLNRNTQQDLTYQAVDPDGDPLTFTIVDGPEHGELWASPTVATYYPRKGYAGPDRFTYVASDGQNTSALATVRFTILAVNNPPVATPQTLVSKPNRPLSLPLGAADPDDDALSFRIAQPPGEGGVELSGSNFVYTPRPGYLGPDSFMFTASDGQSTSTPALISLRLTEQNTAPVAESYGLVLAMNTPTNLVLRARDGENDPLEFTIVTNPVHGQFSSTASGLIFTPQPSYYGMDRFAFIADDGEAQSAPGVVVLTIANPNQRPETAGQALAVTRDAPLSFLLEVTDADHDRLRGAILKGPQNGLLYGLGTNFTYVPNPGFVGSDTFTYRVWDGTTYSALTTVYFSVWQAPPLGPLVFEAVKCLENGTVQIRVASAPGRPLEIHSSTNLTTWDRFLSVTPTLNTVTFLDTNAPASPARFYRAVQP